MKNFYSYKNKMPENDPNLSWNLEISDLSSLPLDDDSLDSMDMEDSLNTPIEEDKNVSESPNESGNNQWLDSNELSQIWNNVNGNVFLDTWEEVVVEKKVSSSKESLWRYLRLIFFSWAVILLGWLSIALEFSFETYIKQARLSNIDINYQWYVEGYKDKLWKVKDLLGLNHISEYKVPKVSVEQNMVAINSIINANDIDYIDKKDLLSPYVSDLVSTSQDKALYIETMKEKIAKQWFLPVELEGLLSDDQAIDTIQRSLNALEIVKFSTATRVFSYMNTALATISEMVRMNGASVENLKQLFTTLNSRWEKDITSYVNMCYLNPFETNANCDIVWDLDLYYNILMDDSINIKLFKNSMNAINQLLEKEDTTLFSITFNWFNAQDKNITFSIEVYTNQEDERILMSQWKKNPNIFILTNIINLLKQSSFIIWAEINTQEINIDTRIVNRWNISKTVNYSNMDFTVPIQKDTEREIFDYIDLDNIQKILNHFSAE